MSINKELVADLRKAQARIEALSAGRLWVPVEERLPGRKEIVIVEMLMRNGERRYCQMVGELIQYNDNVMRWMHVPQESGDE